MSSLRFPSLSLLENFTRENWLAILTVLNLKKKNDDYMRGKKLFKNLNYLLVHKQD